VPRRARARVSVPFPAEHRPWPLPRGPWVMVQRWHELLFAHWSLPAAELRRLVPSSLPLDLYRGQAWIGVVPFRMSNVTARGLPPVPWLSAFPELNLRTYVTLDGRPGVFFFSLDAGNPVAAASARTLHLPYYYARMSLRREGDWIEYATRRLPPGPRPAELRARYRPIGPVYNAMPGSLAYFLAERYCLYAVDRRQRITRVEIHHPPWPLQDAEAEVELNTMTAPLGLRLPDTGPLLHYAARQDMVAWPPEATA
jgi:uncharacterized protein YqjF (DUF2071 family)